MTKEELTALGLNEEQIKSVFALNGKALTAVQNELATTKQTLQQMQDAAKKFDGVDVDKLKGDLAALQTKYNDDLTAAKLDGAINTALLTAKAHDPRAVLPFLDRSLLKLDGEKVLGLTEQVEKLKSEKGFLFEPEQQAGAAFGTGARQNQSSGAQSGTGTAAANAALRAALGRQ